MEKLDKIKEFEGYAEEDRIPDQDEPVGPDEEVEYPQCPHGPWPCPYKTLWPMFKEFGSDYMGHIPTCNLCVQWAEVKQMMKIKTVLKDLTRALELLRYTT